MRAKLLTILLAVTVLVFAGCAVLTESSIIARGVTVKELRCEYRVNPLGIDVAKPRLSWILRSNQRAQSQTAYQILVAGNKDLLRLNVGNLWDSSKVESDQSNQIVYKGKPLSSRMQCYWKVRVWDKNGKISGWSKPAYWTMGLGSRKAGSLLNSQDWQAKWIGYDAEPPTSYKKKEKPKQLSLEGCKYVWFAKGDPRKRAPLGTRYFRCNIEIKLEGQIKRARFALVADNEAVLFINSQRMGKVSGCKTVHVLNVTDTIRAGKNILAIDAKNVGNTPNPAAIAGKLLIEFEKGDPLAILIDNSWKASETMQENWQGPEFDDNAWKAAKEIAKVGDKPWGKPVQEELILPPPKHLRKVFSVNRSVKRAMVYTSALGLYELHINGKRVGNDYFTPGWTDYAKRVYYQSYDVTKLLKLGDNAIGAILADGWYAGYLGWHKGREHYGSQLRLLVQLEVEYTDGGRKTVVTNKSWKAAYGPHLEADFYMGETYDARKELPGWDTPNFDDSVWDQVAVTVQVQGKVQAYPGVTVKKIMEIKPIKRTEPKKGTYVFDMGQNFTGWVRLKVKGKTGVPACAGTSLPLRKQGVVLRFAELLNPDGTIYTENLRSARCTDTYILKGKGQEIWEPRFTFHGFRYVEVTGYPGEPGLDDITGIVIHSDTPFVGSFECSNPMVNQLYSNITWSQRSNFLEVPTDCPQRDERMGWTGDAQVFIRAASYNADVASFFTKWLVDLEDAQRDDGAVYVVAPQVVTDNNGVAAWSDAAVICPCIIYWVYGDTRVLEKHYDMMVRWVEYCRANSKDLLRPAQGYGDWLSINADTPKDVIGTAYFAESTKLVARVARILGKDEDAAKYERLFKEIKAAFNQAYVAEDGRIKGDTQTCYVLALWFELLPEDKCEDAVQYLVENIKNRDTHLSTGFVGTSYLMPTLNTIGQNQLAYQLLLNDTFPSWGYSIKNGATTIWERWDGWTEEKGFQTPGMNSFNHYSFGAVGQWLLGTVAGIETEGPGYKRILIRPTPGGGLTYAKASYKSIHGQIVSDWEIDGQKFTLNVTIPANTTATVYVPAKNAESVTESGRTAADAKQVQFLRMEDGNAVFAVGSGQYRFVSNLP